MTPCPKRLSRTQALSLVRDTTPWLSCDDCFDRIDVYVEALVRGCGLLDVQLRAHLGGCAACLEEAETLIAMAAADAGASPGRAQRDFRRQLRAGRHEP